MDNFKIEEITSFEPSLVAPINALLSELSSREIVATEASLRTITESPTTHLFVVRHSADIVGMLTLGVYIAPTGRKVWIEDVVIRATHRGRGVGRALLSHAIDYARQYRPCSLILTSNPARIAANALYRSQGFEQRATNVYKMEL